MDEAKIKKKKMFSILRGKKQLVIRSRKKNNHNNAEVQRLMFNQVNGLEVKSTRIFAVPVERGSGLFFTATGQTSN